MALATKCPHCHTVFRVALDQLKLRGGIVRCGACNEIFDGNAGLVEASPAAVAAPVPPPVPAALDLELALEDAPAVPDVEDGSASPAAVVRPAPDGQSAAGGADVDHIVAGAADLPGDAALPEDAGDGAAIPALAGDIAAGHVGPGFPSPAGHRLEPRFDIPSEHIVAVALDDLHHFDEEPAARAPQPEPHDAADQAADEAADRAADDAAAADLLAAGPDSALLAAGAGTLGQEAAAIARRAQADAEAERAADTGPDEAHDEGRGGEDEPDFVRRANRRQRGARLARIAMLAGVPLLLLALLAQGVFTLGGRLAASQPDLKPALVALCETLGCTIGLPRQIDALAVEQGELQTLAPDTFSYATVLRNQSRSAQAWPHLELVLKDAAEKPVLRRVFAPRDYLAAPGTAAKGAAGATQAAQAVARGLGPRSEQAVKLYFVLDDVKASGYRIAIFYP